MFKSIAATAATIGVATLLIAMPAAAQMASAKPETKSMTMSPAKPIAMTSAKPAAKTPATRRSTIARSAKSISCSKDADGKQLHGNPRTAFMRQCNKG